MIDIRDAAGVREAQRKRSKCQNVVGKDAHCTLNCTMRKYLHLWTHCPVLLKIVPYLYRVGKYQIFEIGDFASSKFYPKKHVVFCFNLFSWSICINFVAWCCRIPIKLGRKCTVWLSSRAKHGGPVLPADTGSTEDPSTVPGSYDNLGCWNLMTFKIT